jgi:hypothetical protein
MTCTTKYIVLVLNSLHISTREHQASDAIEGTEICAVGNVKKLPALRGNAIFDVTACAAPPVCNPVGKGGRFMMLEQDM